MDLDPILLYVLGGLVTVMAVGTVARWLTLRFMRSPKSAVRMASLKSWWIIVIAVVIAVLTGRLGVTLLLAVVSLLAIREYQSLVPKPGSPWHVRYLAYAAVIVQYVLIFADWQTGFLVFIPVFFFLSVAVRMILTGHTHSFLQDASRLTWGMMLVVYFLSHAANLVNVPVVQDSTGPLGLFLYLLLLTEANDISQALWGRLLGRHRLAPKISPGKTWEGFIGGVATTVALALLLAPLLTPLTSGEATNLPSVLSIPGFWPIAAGVVISISGLFGDLTISEVKRDLGVKDSSSLIPGQGGILDRVDSLTFTAPIFFYLMQAFISSSQ